MNETEFERGIDAVGTAITTSEFIESVQAAKEDEIVQPLAEHHHPVQSSLGPTLGNLEFLQLLLGRL